MRVLVTGASGALGGYLVRELRHRGCNVTAWSGTSQGELFGVSFHPVNLGNADDVAAAFRQARPNRILHAAAWARPVACYQDPSRAWQINGRGSQILAELAATAGARCLLVSTDLVFDGQRGHYREEDIPCPLSVYGQTKIYAEQAVLAYPRHSVARVSLLFGPTLTGRRSFFDEQIAALRHNRTIELFADEWRTPLSLFTAAQALVELLFSDYSGLLHLGGPERLNRLEMGQRLAIHLGADASLLASVSRDHVPGAEPRPRDVSLDSTHWRQLFPHTPWPSYGEALQAFALL